jgi:hypothetical protein
MAGPKYAAVAGEWSRARWTEWIKSSKSRATSHTVISHSARLFARSERQSIMLTTLLVIVVSITAGMIVNHVHPEYRKW